MSNLVDWELAERIATRLARRNDPFADSYHYASLQPDFAELTAAGRGARRRLHRAAIAGRPRSGASHRPRRMGARQHRVVPAPAPPGHRPTRRAAPRARCAAARVEGRRCRGGLAARLDVHARARPVRPPRRRGQPSRARHRVLRRAERPRSREAVRVPAPRVPAVARAPRDRRTARSSPACRGCAATSCRWSSRPSARSIPTRSGSSRH